MARHAALKSILSFGVLCSAILSNDSTAFSKRDPFKWSEIESM